jgi:NAD+-dependent protein deacetylase SIR2
MPPDVVSHLSGLSDLSSDLSSPPSSPIAPPEFYPTPTPSQGPDTSANVEEDMPPARKRRKVEPKPRITQHLDLTSDASQSRYDQQTSLELLLKTLRKRRKIVVVAGAGISVSAGIPDFRSSHGLFESLKHKHKLKTSGKGLFDASVYKDDSSTSTFHDMVRDLSSMASKAKPTLFHQLVARLSREGRLLRLYTQNIDGIDTSLPPLATKVPLSHKAPWPQTIQLHGGLEMMMCQKCQHTSEFQPQLFQGATPPLCPKCMEADSLRTHHAGKRSHGIGKLRPRIVLYNEHNPDEDAIGAVVTSDLRTRPDAIIVVGTSMKIPGVKRIVREMCGIVRNRRDGVSIWINRDPVPVAKEFDDCWDLIIKGDSDEVARQISFRNWDDDSEESSEEYTLSDVERVKARQGPIEVVIPQSPFQQKKSHPLAAGLLTPPTSHEDEMSDRGQSLTINIPIPTSTHTPKMQNPASKGRTIHDLLSKEKRKPKASTTGRPKAPSTKKPKTGTTTTAKQTILTGKVSKQTTAPTSTVGSKPPKKKQKHHRSDPHHNHTASSSSSAIPPSKKPLILFPNLLPQSTSSASSPGPDHPSSPKPHHRTATTTVTTPTATDSNTISPSGRLPSGMKSLLH